MEFPALAAKDIPGLAMTRSIGDTVAHAVGVTAIPEMKHRKLRVGVDRFAIVACDGIWDYIDSQKAVNLVATALEEGENAQGAASRLCNEAADEWDEKDPDGQRDDITAVVIVFSPQP